MRVGGSNDWLGVILGDGFGKFLLDKVLLNSWIESGYLRDIRWRGVLFLDGDEVLDVNSFN